MITLPDGEVKEKVNRARQELDGRILNAEKRAAANFVRHTRDKQDEG